MKNEKDTIAHIVSRMVPWIQKKIPDATGISISNIQKPGMGLSNETYLFDLSWDEKGKKMSRGLVLRCAPQNQKVFPDYHLNHQYLIMKALKGSGVTVPEMLWIEDDISILGSPFYIMERLIGTMPKDYPSYHGSGVFFDATPEQRKRIWWDSLSVLAKINMIEWKSLNLDFLGVPGGGADPINKQLAYWDRFFAWIKDDPEEKHPILEKGLQWLKDNAYAPERVGLCWGDARLGNLLYKETDFNIVAALDWEMAFLGDPEADLAWFIYIDRYLAEEYGLSRLEGLPSAEASIARYEELTGSNVKHYAYNEVFAAVRFGMILVSVIKKLMTMGMHNYGDIIQNNYCTRFLAERLGLPSPGEHKKVEKPDAKKDSRMSVQFQLSGPKGSQWHIISDKGAASRHEGNIENPSCTVKATAEDWHALQTGELNQLDAWSTGRLVVDGDLNVMIQLKDDIKRLSA